MSRTIVVRLALTTLATALIAAFLGVVYAQSSPDLLQECASALAQCNGELKDCVKKSRPEPRVGGVNGGWEWLEAQTASDLSLLLKKAAAAEHIDATTFSAATQGVMAGATTRRAVAGAAIKEFAAKVRENDARESASRAASKALENSNSAPVRAAGH